MSRINKKTVVHASVPRLNELCCVICQTDTEETQDSSAKTIFHWQTMKCRLIIFTMPQVIASPIFGPGGYLSVIVSKEFFQTGKLQAFLIDVNLKISETRPVVLNNYKSCLIYTMLFVIAPSWNKVGRYLVRGRDFLTNTERIDSIELETHVTDGEIRIHIYPGRIRIPFLKLEDLHLSDMHIAQFMADPRGEVDLATYARITWVHVLPSMKRGKILAILKQIPSWCPFNNYDELRRHWKNMYGYRLPKTADGMVYYKIDFQCGSNYFLYPDLCVRAASPEVLRVEHSQMTTSEFLRDLTRAMPCMCDKEFNVITPCASSSTRLTDPHSKRIGDDNLDSNSPRKRIKPNETPELIRRDSRLMSPTPSLVGRTPYAMPTAIKHSRNRAPLNNAGFFTNATSSMNESSLNYNLMELSYSKPEPKVKAESRQTTASNYSFKALEEVNRNSIKTNSSVAVASSATPLKTDSTQNTKNYSSMHRFMRLPPIGIILKHEVTETDEKPILKSDQSVSVFFKERKSDIGTNLYKGTEMRKLPSLGDAQNIIGEEVRRNAN